MCVPVFGIKEVALSPTGEAAAVLVSRSSDAGSEVAEVVSAIFVVDVNLGTATNITGYVRCDLARATFFGSEHLSYVQLRKESADLVVSDMQGSICRTTAMPSGVIPWQVSIAEEPIAGAWICSACVADGDQVEIHALDSDGLWNILSVPGQRCALPKLSCDGMAVAYCVTLGGRGWNRQQSVMLVRKGAAPEELVSGCGISVPVDVSAGGKSILLCSTCDCLCDGDNNKAMDVFVVRSGGGVALISKSPDGLSGNAASGERGAAITGNGDIVFTTFATDLSTSDIGCRLIAMHGDEAMSVVGASGREHVFSPVASHCGETIAFLAGEGERCEAIIVSSSPSSGGGLIIRGGVMGIKVDRGAIPSADE